MHSLSDVLTRITTDHRYLANLSWGESRPGHPEGTIAAHIDELKANLARLSPKLSDEQVAKLEILIHVHDTFKPQADAGAAITAPNSHASLAAAFLSEHCDDADLLAMVRLHDEAFALWRQAQQRGTCNADRLNRLLGAITDWDTFLAFQLIDNTTEGKSSDPLRWFQQLTADRLPHRLTVEDVQRH